MDRVSDFKNIITGIQHVGILTNNVNDTVEFYQKLGFELVYDTKIPESNGRVVFLNLHNIVIETFESEGAIFCQGSIVHIALNVKDVEAARSAIVKLGLEPIEAEIQYLPFWEQGFRYFNVLGPNCETIEFGQIL